MVYRVDEKYVHMQYGKMPAENNTNLVTRWEIRQCNLTHFVNYSRLPNGKLDFRKPMAKLIKTEMCVCVCGLYHMQWVDGDFLLLWIGVSMNQPSLAA